MRITVLGPFAVVHEEGAVTVPKGNERALVALLALHAGRPLPADTIVESLWGEDAPTSARDMVRVYVARARTRLGGSIEHDASGYALLVDEEDVDALLFEHLREQGGRKLGGGSEDEAVALLRQAIDLWRGEALQEFRDFPFAREAIPRLEEARLAATEDLCDAELAFGHAAQLVPLLERLVEENPYRERLRGQLMLALYRDGRQAEALAHYRDGRRRLVEEIGIEPGPKLRDLERSILQHDPILDGPAHPKHGGSTPAVQAKRKRRTRLAALATVGLVAGLGVALSVFEMTRGSATVRVVPNSLAVVDGSSGRLEASVRLPGVPVDVATDTRDIWVALGEPHEIAKIRRRTRTVAKIPVAGVPRRIVRVPGGLWIDSSYSGAITRLDVFSGSVGRPIRLFPPTRISFAWGRHGLWAAGSPGGEAVELDPRTARVRRRIRDLDSPSAIATDPRGEWFASANRAEVQHVLGGTSHRIPIGSSPVDVAVGLGAAWAVTPADGKLWRIDPRRNDVVAIVGVPADPESVVVADGSVWVGSRQPGVLTRVDPTTNRVVSSLVLGRPIDALTSSGRKLWVVVA